MAEKEVLKFLKELGEDVTREGLIDTPKRVVRADKELYKGYIEDIDKKITTFNSEKYDEMVLLRDIEFYSNCEHHIQPFFGKGHIAYIPDKKIVGISKLARILDHFSRRLQNQERITQQVADYIVKKINPLGVGVILEAQHFCMRARGVQKQNSIMVTSCLRGVFEKYEVRNEFFQLIRL